MTIDEAIKLYKDLERINREEYKIFNRDGLNPKSALITAQRYEQLVEWLKELKELRQKDAQIKDAISECKMQKLAQDEISGFEYKILKIYGVME